MHTWQGQVRDYELDIQQVVNNANYLNYFEHARHLILRELGIDFVTWHQQHLDFVLVESNIKYKKPLRSQDQFIITSTMHRKGRVRICFSQNIYLITHSQNQPGDLIAEALFTAACVDTKRNKACMPPELSDILEKL